MSEIHPERSFPGWVGCISREEAERRLEGKEIGTFVLREGDELNSRILSALEIANHEQIDSCVLTVVESGEKIAEYLILHTPQGWTLYQDNPDLLDIVQYRFSPTLPNLLDKIHEIAKKPLRMT